jgi:hypothetical protein
MAKDSEYFLSPAPQSTAQRKIAKEATIHQESPLPTTIDRTAPADIKGNVTITSRAYQLEMLEESLERNIILTVWFFLRYVTISS